MSDTPVNTDGLTMAQIWRLAIKKHKTNKYNVDTVKLTPFIGKASKDEKVVKLPLVVYAAVKSTPFIGKASKEEKVVKPKSPKKVVKKAVETDDFHKMLFKFFPPNLHTSPPFSDGQIDEFQCRHCGIHKELDDETWYACPYAIFHGLIKSGSAE
jgi:hypothetical protein